jgi:hypothetical protein
MPCQPRYGLIIRSETLREFLLAQEMMELRISRGINSLQQQVELLRIPQFHRDRDGER